MRAWEGRERGESGMSRLLGGDVSREIREQKLNTARRSLQKDIYYIKWCGGASEE